MLKIIKESFNITNSYLVYLATPLVLFSFISSLYLIFSANGGKISLIISVILFLLMLAAFIAGWLYMVSNCVRKAGFEDKLSLIVEFPSGVGEYFLSSLGLVFNILVISLILYVFTQLLGNHYIGDVGITAEAIRRAQASPESAKIFFDSLSQLQINKLFMWFALSSFTASCCSFLFMFYSPSIMYKTKNPFKALFVSMKDLFSGKFFKNVLLFLIVLCSYIILILVSSLMTYNLFLQFVINLVNFYYMVFITVYVYNYYYTNYAKIGSNIDVNV